VDTVGKRFEARRRREEAVERAGEKAPRAAGRSGRVFFFRALHLTALSFFAVAWPILDLLGRNPEFFVVRGSRSVDIVLLALGLTLVPPLLLLAVEALAHAVAGPRLSRALHLVFVGVLAGAFALLVLGWIDAPSVAALSALAVGAAAAVAYGRFEPVRSVVTLLAVAVPVFLGLFFFGSPSGELVVSGGDARLANVEVKRPAPVVMVVFDEFPVTSLLDPSGEIDAARFPAFAALAREATWYRNAVTVDANTSHAVPALLTGRNEGGAAILSNHPQNLFTLLGRTYRIEAAEAVTRLCPDDLCPRGTAERFGPRLRSLADDVSVVYGHEVLPDALRDRLPSISGVWGDFGDQSERPGRDGLGANFVLRNLLPGSVRGREVAFETFNRTVRPTRTPTLFFLHVLLPHYPWEHAPSGRVYDGLTIPGLTADYWTGGEFEVNQAWQRHIAQVGYTDRLVADLIAGLKETGMWDESLVVLVADHGTSFRPGEPRKAITRTTAPDVAYVPLFVKAPGQEAGKTVDETVSTLDVLPTIAGHLGIELPWDVPGVSLAGDSTRDLDTVQLNAAGGTLRIEADELGAERDERVALQAELFGRTWADLYRFGERPDLVGRRPSALVVSTAADGVTASLDRRDAVATASVVPAFVTGSVPGESDVDVVILVNGRVGAVVPTYPEDGELRFSALLPESLFRPGPNEIRARALSAPSPTP
jgi:Sulfatase